VQSALRHSARSCADQIALTVLEGTMEGNVKDAGGMTSSSGRGRVSTTEVYGRYDTPDMKHKGMLITQLSPIITDYNWPTIKLTISSCLNQKWLQIFAERQPFF